MPETFTFEEAQAPATFSFEEASAGPTFTFEEASAPPSTAGRVIQALPGAVAEGAADATLSTAQGALNAAGYTLHDLIPDLAPGASYRQHVQAQRAAATAPVAASPQRGESFAWPPIGPTPPTPDAYDRALSAQQSAAQTQRRQQQQPFRQAGQQLVTEGQTFGQLRQDWQALGLTPQDVQDRLPVRVAQAVGSTLPAIVTTLATGGRAAPTMVTMAFQQYQQAFDAAIQAGQDPDTAHRAGLLNAPSALLESAGDIPLARGIGQSLEAAWQATKQRIPWKQLAGKIGVGVGTSAVGEGAEEGLQQEWQHVVENDLLGYQHQDWPTRLKEDWENFKVGALAGGVLRGAGSAFDVAANARRPAGAPLSEPAGTFSFEEAQGAAPPAIAPTVNGEVNPFAEPAAEAEPEERGLQPAAAPPIAEKPALAAVAPAVPSQVATPAAQPVTTMPDREETAPLSTPAPEARGLQAAETPDIPLGLNRPDVPDPSLRQLSEAEFDAEFQTAKRQVNEGEKLLDTTDLDQLTRAQRQQIATAQDRWSAADLERFRRNYSDTHTEDIFHKMIDLADLDSQSRQARFKVLLEILRGRQGVKGSDVVGVYRMLPPHLLNNPDFQEATAGKLARFKEWLQQADRQPQPATPQPLTPARRRKRSEPMAGVDREWDLIDEIQGAVGRIDPALIRERDPNWTPDKDVKDLFKPGAVRADQAIRGLTDAGPAFGLQADTDPAELGHRLNQAAANRRDAVQRAKRFEAQMKDEAKAAEARGKQISTLRAEIEQAKSEAELHSLTQQPRVRALYESATLAEQQHLNDVASRRVEELQSLPFSLDTGPLTGEGASDEQTAARQKQVKGLEAYLSERHGWKGVLRTSRLSVTESSAGRAAAAAFEAFQRIFRRRLIFIHGSSNIPFNGMINPADPTTLFIRTDTRKAPFVVIGHEFIESVQRTDRPLYERLSAGLAPLMRDLPGYRERLNQQRQRADLPAASLVEAQKELIADFTGDALARPEFLRRLEQREPALFREFAEKMLAFLRHVMDWIRNGGYGANRHFTDLARAEQHLADALAEHVRRTGESSPADASESLPFSLDLDQPQQDERKLFPRLMADPGLTLETRQQITNRFYAVAHNTSSEAAAQQLVDELGPQAAAQLALDPPSDFPPAISGFLASAVARQAAILERAAVATEGKQQWQAFAADFMNRVLEKATGLGQWINALKAFSYLTPEGAVLTAQRLLDQASDRVLSQYDSLLRAARQALAAAHQQAVDATVKTPGVFTVANEAIVDATVNDPAVQQQIRADAAQDLAQLSTPQLSTLPATLDHGAVLAEILGHYAPGAELKPLWEKLAALGVPPEQAKSFAAWLDRKFAEAVQTGTTAATRKARAATKGKPDFSDRAVDQLIRRKLREWGIRLRQAVGQGQVNGQALGDAIVQASGLTGAAAQRLRDAINRRFAQLAQAAKRKEIDRLFNQQKQDKRTRRLRRAFDKVIEASNLGALEQADLLGIVKAALKLKTLTPEQAAWLRQLANAVQAIPEDQTFRRQEATIKLQNAIAKLEGIAWWEWPMAFWYAHILSGPATHLVNAASNAINLAGALTAQTLTQPGSVPTVLPALARGVRRGWPEALQALRTGAVTGPRIAEKFQDPGVWQKVDSRWLLPWEMVGRALAAADLVFFYPAAEQRQALMARGVAKTEGRSGRALRQRVAELMHSSEAAHRAAAVQATQEGYTGLQHTRRVNEILEQRRGDEYHETGRDFALRTTFNNTPYGVLGLVAQTLNAFSHRQPWFKTIVPFTNIISNVVNESLTWTPIGSVRALKADTWGVYGKPIDRMKWADQQQVAELHAKAAVGTLLLSVIAIAASRWLDEDDPPFAVTGQGPKDKSKRDTLRETGWRPNSVKLGGRYYSYQQTPAAVGLAIVGNYLDARKYGHLAEGDALNALAYTLSMSAKTVVQQSFLDSLARLTGLVMEPSEKFAGQGIASWGGRALTSFAVPSVVREIERVFYDDRLYEADTVRGEILRNLPFVRSHERATLNGLGEPVRRPFSDRFTSPVRPDPIWRELARLNVGIYPRSLSVAGKALSDDQVYEVVRASGPRIRQRIEAVSRTRGYQHAPDADQRGDRKGKREILQTIVDEERQKAKRQVLGRR